MDLESCFYSDQLCFDMTQLDILPKVVKTLMATKWQECNTEVAGINSLKLRYATFELHIIS